MTTRGWVASAVLFSILTAACFSAAPARAEKGRKSCCESRCPGENPGGSDQACCREMPAERQVHKAASVSPVISASPFQLPSPALAESSSPVVPFFPADREVGPHSGLSPPLA